MIECRSSLSRNGYRLVVNSKLCKSIPNHNFHLLFKQKVKSERPPSCALGMSVELRPLPEPEVIQVAPKPKVTQSCKCLDEALGLQPNYYSLQTLSQDVGSIAYFTRDGDILLGIISILMLPHLWLWITLLLPKLLSTLSQSFPPPTSATTCTFGTL